MDGVAAVQNDIPAIQSLGADVTNGFEQKQIECVYGGLRKSSQGEEY